MLFLGLQCLTFLPVDTQIGKWSEISATSIPDRKCSRLLPLIKMLSIRVADSLVILVGLVIVGTRPAAKNVSRRCLE